MTLEGNFIQKQDARKVTIGIIMFLVDFFLSMATILCQYEKMVVHKILRMNEWINGWMDE